MDDTYQTYLNRVARLTLPAAHRSQLQNIQESPKFKAGNAQPFPGYSVNDSPWPERADNLALAEKLVSLQAELVQRLGDNFIVPVQPESFHLTLADLIWADRYKDAVQENPEFEIQLRDRIAQCFQKSRSLVCTGKPIQLQLLGLILRPRAIALCLVPQNEEGYERILHLRRSIYQNSGIIALGIEQQYHFTAHITLGYFGPIPSDLNRDRCCDLLATLNDQWVEAEFPVLTVERAQLCKFDDMTRFYRQPDWPQLDFLS